MGFIVFSSVLLRRCMQISDWCLNSLTTMLKSSLSSDIPRGFRAPEVPVDLFFLSSCWVAFGRPFYLWTVLPGVPRHWRVPPASGGHPPRLIPPSGGLGLLPGAWGAPKRGMPMGPKLFLALPDACGLRPCDRAHLKNGLVPYSCVGGTQR